MEEHVHLATHADHTYVNIPHTRTHAYTYHTYAHIHTQTPQYTYTTHTYIHVHTTIHYTQYTYTHIYTFAWSHTAYGHRDVNQEVRRDAEDPQCSGLLWILRGLPGKQEL